MDTTAMLNVRFRSRVSVVSNPLPASLRADSENVMQTVSMSKSLRRAMTGIMCAGTLVAAMATAEADDSERQPPRPTVPTTATKTGQAGDVAYPAVGSVALKSSTGLAPLLREGSQVQRVRGMIHQDIASGTWRFTLLAEESDALTIGRYRSPENIRHEFIMLPNAHLGEMQQVAGSMPDRDVVFQVTGDVFVYQHRNYLLVSFPPRIVSERQSAPVERDAQGDGGAVRAGELQPNGDGQRQPRTAADIMRELERETGPVGRSPVAPSRERDLRAGSERLVPEGTSIQFRRGRISRDSGGAWQFVFDADATGQVDPPMTLLPCQLLHQIENYARRAGSNAPVLISGRVTAHGGRNYLLPTVFQIPRERTPLHP
jgi:hypothetical protein